MAITNTWSVTNMQRTDADGAVFLIYWSMVAASDGTIHPTLLLKAASCGLHQMPLPQTSSHTLI
jgi:hypothetical protein